MNQEVVSIIVPVYNAEKYLERCLNSIMNQTYPYFEVIMANDGSVDRSHAICQEFSAKDSRFKEYCQENKGPSAARNLALRHISGDYLCCVDADDCLREDALEILVRKMKSTNADVCIYAWKFLYEGGKVEEYCFAEEEMATTVRELYHQLMLGNYRGGGGNPWNKIWRLDKSKPNGGMKMFDEGIRIYEDMLWVIQNLESCKTVVFENKCLYDYYILDTSISRRGKQVERRRQFYLGAKRVYEYLRDHHGDMERIAQIWYRDRFYPYLLLKYKEGLKIESCEKVDVRKISINPVLYTDFKRWLKFVFIRFIVCR